MVLRPPAIEAMSRVSGLAAMLRTNSKMRSATASLSAAVRISLSNRLRCELSSQRVRIRKVIGAGASPVRLEFDAAVYLRHAQAEEHHSDAVFALKNLRLTRQAHSRTRICDTGRSSVKRPFSGKSGAS